MFLIFELLLFLHLSILVSHTVIGSHLPLTSPALEFVKASTHVMGLDPQLALEVASLRRLLLTQVLSAM